MEAHEYERKFPEGTTWNDSKLPWWAGALQEKDEEIERLKENMNVVMCVYCGFKSKKDANIMAKHIIEECEKRPDSMVNMTKVLEDFKALEKSLQEMILANELAEAKISSLEEKLAGAASKDDGAEAKQPEDKGRGE